MEAFGMTLLIALFFYTLIREQKEIDDDIQRE